MEARKYNHDKLVFHQASFSILESSLLSPFPIKGQTTYIMFWVAVSLGKTALGRQEGDRGCLVEVAC